MRLVVQEVLAFCKREPFPCGFCAGGRLLFCTLDPARLGRIRCVWVLWAEVPNRGLDAAAGFVIAGAKLWGYNTYVATESAKELVYSETERANRVFQERAGHDPGTAGVSAGGDQPIGVQVGIRGFT